MPEPSPSLAEQIAAVKRELALRGNVYPGWVRKGRMSQAKADHEIAAMRAVLASLEGMAAPGDATERARALIAQLEPYLQEMALEEPLRRMIAAALTAAEGRARRAARPVIEAARALVAQTRYVVGLPDGDPYKGTGNRLADALAEYDRALVTEATPGEGGTTDG